MIPYKILTDMRHGYIYVIYRDGAKNGKIKQLTMNGLLEDLIEENYGIFFGTRLGILKFLPFKANTKKYGS